jgi:OmpA-like transmembrane domain
MKCTSSVHTHVRCSLSILFVVLVGLAPEVACAADLLGLYIGGAAGQSQLRGDIKPCGPLVESPGASCLGGIFSISSVSFARNTTGWEAFAGIRPVPFLGAEVEYIDFGSSGGSSVAINSTANTMPLGAGSATTHPTATALYAVGYLPVPLPHLDIFAKAGVAELRSNINFSGELGCVVVFAHGAVCDPVALLQSSVKSTNTRPAYGAGLQMKLGSFALRAAYERMSVNTGDPALLSLGLIWRVW